MFPGRITAFAAVLLTLAFTPVAGASLTMYIGAAEDEGRNGDPLVAGAKMALAHDAGFQAIRVTALWKTGMSELPLDQQHGLRGRSVAGCDSLQTIPKDVLGPHPVGSLSPDELAALDRALRFALGIRT